MHPANCATEAAHCSIRWAALPACIEHRPGGTCTISLHVRSRFPFSIMTSWSCPDSVRRTEQFVIGIIKQNVSLWLLGRHTLIRPATLWTICKYAGRSILNDTFAFNRKNVRLHPSRIQLRPSSLYSQSLVREVSRKPRPMRSKCGRNVCSSSQFSGFHKLIATQRISSRRAMW